jgi:hypothetical protein
MTKENIRFPQQVQENGNEVKHASDKIKGPNYFKTENNISFIKPERICRLTVSGSSISIKCETKCLLNRMVQTHETSMHQKSFCIRKVKAKSKGV